MIFKTAIANPRKYDPQSPIKIDAGYELKTKNPNEDDSINDIKKILQKLPEGKERIKSPNDEILITPAAKPSNPSNQFIAFVIPTINNVVIQTLVNVPNSRSPCRGP